MIFGMTPEMLLSHLRSLAKTVGGALVAFGLTNQGIVDATTSAVFDVFGALLTAYGFAASHWAHSPDTAAPSK